MSKEFGEEAPASQYHIAQETLVRLVRAKLTWLTPTLPASTVWPGGRQPGEQQEGSEGAKGRPQDAQEQPLQAGVRKRRWTTRQERRRDDKRRAEPRKQTLLCKSN